METNAATAFFLYPVFVVVSDDMNHFLGLDTNFIFTVHVVIVLQEAFRQLARKASGRMRRMSKGVALIWKSSKNYLYHGFPSDISSKIYV